MLCLLAVILSLTAPAQAQTALTFPDPGDILGVSGRLIQKDYIFSENYTCDAWQWSFPSQWDAERIGLVMSGIAQAVFGWQSQSTVVDGCDAYVFTRSDAEQVVLFPYYEGAVLLLVPPGCELIPITHATPAPTNTPGPVAVPAQTVAPSSGSGAGSASAGFSGGSWEWQTVQVDCPSCVGGRCSVCNGTGWYRLYGQKVACSTLCSSCNGLGTISQRQYVYVNY